MGCVGPETQETQVWEWAVCAGMGRYAGTGTDPPVSPRIVSARMPGRRNETDRTGDRGRGFRWRNYQKGEGLKRAKETSHA